MRIKFRLLRLQETINVRSLSLCTVAFQSSFTLAPNARGRSVGRSVGQSSSQLGVASLPPGRPVSLLRPLAILSVSLLSLLVDSRGRLGRWERGVMTCDKGCTARLAGTRQACESSALLQHCQTPAVYSARRRSRKTKKGIIAPNV